MNDPSIENNQLDDEGWDKPMFDSYLPMDHKLEYILKPKHYSKQSKDNCLICKIVKEDESIRRFEIYRDDLLIVFLNLFPYTSGHLLISPLKHKTEYEELSTKELHQFNILIQRCIEMLKHFSRTESFNVGWNQGKFSGGSVKHFHIHIVPRYPKELNFIEIIAKTRPMIVTLEECEKYLQRYQPFLAGEKTIKKLFER